MVDCDFDRFRDDRKTFSATIRELEIIGEAVSKISDDLKDRFPEVLWQEIRSFRNKITHEYFGVDARIVWDIVENELGPLRSQIISILDSLK